MPRKEVGGRRPNHHNLKHRFDLVQTLGQGTYGKVKLAVEKSSGIEYAIKTIKKQKIGNDKDMTRIHREIEIMTKLSHPHITSVYEVFENAEKIVLVMEYASGGELYDFINDKQGLYEEEARTIFRQIVSAAYYLHMIADFGLANIYSKDKMLNTYCGSPLYASPEIVNGLPYTGPEVDCWSLGVLLFTLVYGAMPFDGSDFRKLRNQITTGNYYEPEHSSDAAGLIRFMLTPNPAKRATVHDICDHWWTNLGYDCRPVEEASPGKPVNLAALEESLSANHSSSDSEEDIVKKKPIKGILKKSMYKQENKQFSHEFENNGYTTETLYSNIKDKCPVLNEKGKPSPSAIRVVACDTGNEKSTCPSNSCCMRTVYPNEPRKGILKSTKEHTNNGSVSDYIMNKKVCECKEGKKDPSSVRLGSQVALHSATSAIGAQNIAEACDDRAVCKVSDRDYGIDDIESILSIDELHLFDYNQPTNGSPFMKSFSSRTSVCQEDKDSETNDQTAQENPEENVGNEMNIHKLAFADTPVTDRNIFQNARNTARELFDSLTSSNPARKIRSILKRNGRFSDGVDSTWRHSLGSAGSSSSGDLLDFSYDSGEAFSGATGETVPKPTFSLLPRDVNKSDDQSQSRESIDHCLTKEHVKEEGEDMGEYGTPPPLPTSLPPSLNPAGSSSDYLDASHEPGEICFEESELHEPGEIHFSDENGISKISIGFNSEETINKLLEDDYESIELKNEQIAPSLFDLAEARGVYQKALELCNKWS